MKYFKILFISYFFGGLLVALNSCQKQDHAYRQFLEGGEKIYVGKADSLQTFSGKNRVKLQWLLLADPTIKGAVVYWGNRRDSLRVEFQKTDDIDTISVVVPDLEEGGHDFEVVTFDDSGNRSIVRSTYGYAYGSKYAASLLPRSLAGVELGENNALVFNWRPTSAQLLKTRVSYTNKENEIHVVEIDSSQHELVLADWKEETPVQYASWHKPDSTAIDTFLSVDRELDLRLEFNADNEVDPALFSRYGLPGDAPDWDGSGNDFTNLWSGVLAGGAPARAWYRTANGSGIPHHFQIDLGRAVAISKIRLWQRGSMTEHQLLYANGNLKQFEIWGSVDPAPDGSYTGWIKLQDGEIIKPSGKPVGENEDIDVQAAEAGHLFEFGEDSPSVRYLRIKVLKTWANTDYMFTSEMRLWEWGTTLVY